MRMPGRRVLLYFERPQKCIFHQIVQIGQSTCLQRPAHCSYPTIYQSQGVEDIVVVKKCFMHSWSVHSAYGIGYYLLCHRLTTTVMSSVRAGRDAGTPSHGEWRTYHFLKWHSTLFFRGQSSHFGVWFDKQNNH